MKPETKSKKSPEGSQNPSGISQASKDLLEVMERENIPVTYENVLEMMFLDPLEIDAEGQQAAWDFLEDIGYEKE